MNEGERAIHQVVVGEHTTVPLEELAITAGLPKAEVKRAMQRGAVWLARGGGFRRLRRAGAAVRPGDAVWLYHDPSVLAERPEPLSLVADEGDYSVWFKPFGLRAQGSKWGDHCTVHRQVALQLGAERPVFLVHRLDRAACGLVLTAHGKRTAAALMKQFEARVVDKRYRVQVHGHFPPGPVTCDTSIDDRPARSHFTLLQHDADAHRSWLEVRIETGRKHQIRRHAAELGFPVVGDRRYGTATDGEDLRLVAYALTFRCPRNDTTRSYLLPEGLVAWLPRLA
ncbi:MAG: RNA pseudouridine synthase [Planctomycetes bacterium]|nr:RNA pseudouridine synthase [Planctomycetota bacterium]